MTPDQGDLVLLPFPFSDLSAGKRRPAIVVSPDRVHRRTNDRIVVALTSNLEAGSAAGSVHLTSRELKRGRLPRPSVALPGKLFTIHRSLIVRTLGRLRPEPLEAILAELRSLFGRIPG